MSKIWTVADFADAMADATWNRNQPAMLTLDKHRPGASHCDGWEVLAWPCPTAAKVLDELLGDQRLSPGKPT